MDDQLSEDEKSPSEYREDLFNTLCGGESNSKPIAYATSMLPPKAQCPVCSKWFRDKTRVHEHLNVHYGARPLYCNVCGTTFAARSNLIKHAQQHHAPYKCYICGHGPYADLRLLTDHTRNHHEELHRFACHLCKASFPRQADLSDHLVTHPPALLEVRRRKRSPDSPVDMSADADDLVAKRPHSAFGNGTPEPESEPSASANIDFMVPKAEASVYPPAFFGLDVSMKHASVEELASQISKLTNFAANLQQNGMLFPNGVTLGSNGSILPMHLAPFANASAPPPQAHVAPMPKYDANGCTKPDLKPDSRLPSILLRKQPTPNTTYHERGRASHENGSRTTRDSSRSQSSERSNGVPGSVASRASDVATQCTLLDEQSALLALNNVPPCQREILVFQQLLAKLISRGDVFRCQHCEIIFFERGIYSLHRSLHDVHNPFQCAICGKRCANKDNFTLHFVNQKHHTGGCTGACIALPSHDAELAHTNGK